MANQQGTIKKIDRTNQVLALLGILLTVLYLVKNASYLYSEIFRESVSFDYRLVYIVGLLTYIIFLVAYLLFMFKLRVPALIVAFLGIFQIIRRIFSAVQAKNPQPLSVVDMVFCIAAAILLILLLAFRKPQRLLGWLLAIVTLAYVVYGIVSNWAILLAIIQSLTIRGENLWNGLINILNFFNLYLLLAVCFVLAALAESMRGRRSKATAER